MMEEGRLSPTMPGQSGSGAANLESVDSEVDDLTT
jgi:hypothetical protein